VAEAHRNFAETSAIDWNVPTIDRDALSSRSTRRALHRREPYFLKLPARAADRKDVAMRHADPIVREREDVPRLTIAHDRNVEIALLTTRRAVPASAIQRDARDLLARVVVAEKLDEATATVAACFVVDAPSPGHAVRVLRGDPRRSKGLAPRWRSRWWRHKGRGSIRPATAAVNQKRYTGQRESRE